MKTKVARLARVIMMAALAFAGVALAQTTSSTVDVRDFEIISVDGNKLVVRGQAGTQEITVPNDFRFTVDGKKLAVSELRAGMKGTATVTTKTTVTPVVVTEIREGTVLRASDVSMTVRIPNGETRRFTRGDLSTRGIQIFMEGKAVQMGSLQKGDKLTATIITNAAPVVLTEKEVQATLAQPEVPAQAAPTSASTSPSPAPAPPPAAAQPASTPPPAAAQPSSTPATPSPTLQTSPVAPASPSGESPSHSLAWFVLIAVVVAAAVFFAVRQKGAA